MARLEITTEADASRLRCPRNHSAVGPTNDHWLCMTCARYHDDVDPEFDCVVDRITGERYRRDEVELDFGVSGVYPA